ncbi:hypothetical protein [Leucobacter massiliensis]|uniref:hypothetical protein n=1 Tax=Leucobacter massiliensis TaxID=1686285 RepID=UPI0011B24C04|nr:hypothetical protein [Leucobacter massiliensis]
MNLTMVQTAFGVAHVDGAYWTLWIELLFYILIAMLMSIGLTERRVYAFVVLWPIVGALAQHTGFPFLADVLASDYAPFLRRRNGAVPHSLAGPQSPAMASGAVQRLPRGRARRLERGAGLDS